MAKDSDFETLLSKYRVAIAQLRDLKEQMTQKEKAWDEIKKEQDIIEKLTRDLCEHILAKDKNEMVLGREYSWSSVKIKDLVKKADKCFIEYNKERAENLNELMDKIEAKNQQIDSLTSQYNRYKISGDVNELLSAEETMEKIEAEKRESAGRENLPNMIKAAEMEGKVNVIIEDGDVVTVDGEEKLLSEMADIHEQITTASIPVVKGTKAAKFKKEIKDAAIKSHMIDLTDFEKNMNDCMWKVLEGVGKYGYSLYPDIEGFVMRSMLKATKSTVRTNTKALYAKNALVETQIKTPLKPSVFAYQLSDIGVRLFIMHFEEEPVTSELERVIAEHDNPEHGYGIMDVETILKEKGWYSSISSYNRKTPIKIEGTDKTYIPDLLCKSGTKYIDYYEYERGHHTQTDFNQKCNKMMNVTRYLNFVVPNKKILEKLKTQVEVWIPTKGKEGLTNITLRITTFDALRKAENKDDECWQIIYRFNKGLEPVKDIET